MAAKPELLLVVTSVQEEVDLIPLGPYTYLPAQRDIKIEVVIPNPSEAVLQDWRRLVGRAVKVVPRGRHAR